jgi:hypothetical protein
VRFENKNIFYYICTSKNALAYNYAGVVDVNSKVVVLGPEVTKLE